MKGIKFRGFYNGTMFNIDLISITDGGWDCLDYIDGKPRRGISLTAQPHIEVMQYTGLKDENSVEIYEGDICRFDNGDTFLVQCETWIEFYGKWLKEPECEDQLRDWYRAGNSEVIGNIHENPELLE